VNPKAAEFYGHTTITSMPPTEAKPEEVEAITHYVLSLGGHASPPNRGEEIFEENGCQACHAREGEDPRRGPSLAGFGSREWVRGIILEPAAPRYFGNDNRMPSFQGKLSASELDDLLTYLLSMRMTEETAGGKP
jgi:cytochrome c2